jgi:hypothetical protein
MSERKEKLESLSLYKLSKSEPVGTKLDIVTHGIGEFENDEYGHAYVLSDGRKITFVNFGFGDKESVVHRAIRDALENDPNIVDYKMVISLSLHKPKNKNYGNYWAIDRIIVSHEAADKPQQKTVVEYV